MASAPGTSPGTLNMGPQMLRPCRCVSAGRARALGTEGCPEVSSVQGGWPLPLPSECLWLI